MHSSSELRKMFDSFLDNYKFHGKPKSLYDPIEYIMHIGGKRIRPVLVSMGCDLFGADPALALDASLALEIFHNFTLVHDDIMDEADLRRGKLTVHKKFSNNIAILSGDLMLIKAYTLLCNYENSETRRIILNIFNKFATELCEGQQMDMEFEVTADVSVDEYIEMITLKTGVLIAGALQMGAVIGGASVGNASHLYKFGLNLGIAFQLQDDLLDTFGNMEKVGKKIGGDIIQNKKTYLYLKALELSDTTQRQKLLEIYSNKVILSEIDKVKTVTEIFNDVVVKEYAHQVRDAYLDLAYAHLAAISVPDDKKTPLKHLAAELLNREN